MRSDVVIGVFLTTFVTNHLVFDCVPSLLIFYTYVVFFLFKSFLLQLVSLFVVFVFDVLSCSFASLQLSCHYFYYFSQSAR